MIYVCLLSMCLHLQGGSGSPLWLEGGDRNFAPHQVLGVLSEMGSMPSVGSCVNGLTAAGQPIHICFAPDTPEWYIQEVSRRIFGDFGPAYSLGARWSNTANGSTGSIGNPIQLTWSFVPDGVSIPGSAGEPTSPCNLTARFNAQFGGNTALWQSKFAESFNRWQELSGILYTQVSDDGAIFPNSPGQLGRRGDVRVSGHTIDGSGGILAYNFLPDTGDMVIDTGDSWSVSTNNFRFLRNTVMHEHGHGIGLLHVLPRNCTKLMEAFLCTNFDGPQDDDIRGAQRLYGDRLENNDLPATASPLGSGPSITVNDVSLDAVSDIDWYAFTAPANRRVTINVTPVGASYSVGPDPGTPVTVDTRRIINLDLQLRNSTGGTILASSTANGVGLSEQITNHPLFPAGATFLVRVFPGSGSTNDTQRYTLTISMTSVPVGDLTGDGCVNDKDLAQLLRDFGTNAPHSDINGNGIVDNNDLLSILLNFGQGC